MWRYNRTRQGRRIFTLNLRDTMREQGALRLVWLNIKQAIDELRNRKQTS